MDAVATRFTLPVRSAAFSPSGLNLAAGGDDEGIKLIDIATCKVFRHLKAQVCVCGRLLLRLLLLLLPQPLDGFAPQCKAALAIFKASSCFCAAEASLSVTPLPEPAPPRIAPYRRRRRTPAA